MVSRFQKLNIGIKVAYIYYYLVFLFQSGLTTSWNNIWILPRFDENSLTSTVSVLYVLFNNLPTIPTLQLRKSTGNKEAN